MSTKNECGPQTNHESCKTCGNRLESILCANPDVLQIVEKARVPCRFKAGQVIFYSGNDPLGIFTIQSGLVKLEATSVSGTTHTLRLVGPGGTLGYRSMFANEPYQASAVAVEDCNLCFIPKGEVLNIFRNYPELTLNLLSHISKDLRLAEEKWMDQIDKGVSERIAEALIFLQDHFAHQTWTRRDIAQWAGTTPETVIRTLAQFEKDGLVDQSDGRNIRILSRDRLKDRAEIR